MEFCFTCQCRVRPRLKIKRSYHKWSDTLLDHLRREHNEVFPYLCSNELISDAEEQPPVNRLLDIIYSSLSSSDFYKVIEKLWYPYNIWIYL